MTEDSCLTSRLKKGHEYQEEQTIKEVENMLTQVDI